MFDNLKITFELHTPFVSQGYPIHLDGLVAYALTKREIPYLDKATEEDFDNIYNSLPIAKYEQEGEWVYQASAMMTSEDVHHTSRFYTQRTNQLDLAKKAVSGNIQFGKMKVGETLKPHGLKLDLARGAQRNLLGYYSTREVAKVHCYCVGDKEQLEEILIDYGYINHLGGRRREGHGAIKSIKIEVCDKAGERWKCRNKPWSLCSDDVQAIGTTKAPYWNKKERAYVFCPSSVL